MNIRIYLFIFVFFVMLFIGAWLVQTVQTASVHRQRQLEEVTYLKPWSMHLENRAAFRASPLEVA